MFSARARYVPRDVGHNILTFLMINLLNLVYLVSYLASTYLSTYFVRLLTFINA